MSALLRILLTAYILPVHSDFAFDTILLHQSSGAICLLVNSILALSIVISHTFCFTVVNPPLTGGDVEILSVLLSQSQVYRPARPCPPFSVRLFPGRQVPTRHGDFPLPFSRRFYLVFGHFPQPSTLRQLFTLRHSPGLHPLLYCRSLIGSPRPIRGLENCPYRTLDFS